MKKLVLVLIEVALLFAAVALSAEPQAGRLHIVFAQTGGGHSAALLWTLSTDDTTGNCAAPSVCSQNVYRIAGTCPVPFVTSSTPLSSVGATATSFTDNAPLFGNSCYAVTFVINSSESAFSNGAGGSLRPASPSTLSDVEK